MKSLVLCAILISTIVCQPQFVDVFVDVAENTEHYRHILVDAEKSVNMRRNETSYPHRRLIAARYARHKSVMDTGVSLAGITVAQTNCTIPDRFEYRQNYENYNNCVVIDGLRETCETKVVYSIFYFEPPEEQGVTRQFNCTAL